MDNIWHTNKEEPITYTYIVFKFNTPFGDDIKNQNMIVSILMIEVLIQI